jgi:hypothetical protein
MSFDEIYSPGMQFDTRVAGECCRPTRQFFYEGRRRPTRAGATDASAPSTQRPAEASGAEGTTAGDDAARRQRAERPAAARRRGAKRRAATVPATTHGRLAWHFLSHGGWDDIAEQLRVRHPRAHQHQPYFAAYIKVATCALHRPARAGAGRVGLSAAVGDARHRRHRRAALVLFPLVFGWRTIFSAIPGSSAPSSISCASALGYIIVEVGLIAHFMLALSNATVSASVLITGMLVFSGLGSFVSERFLDRARTIMPKIFLAIGAILIAYGLCSIRLLDAIGTCLTCAASSAALRDRLPAGLPDGLPDADRHDDRWRALGKDHMFLWPGASTAASR